MFRVALFAAALVAGISSGVQAQEKSQANTGSPGALGSSVRSITPIYSQLVVFSFPAGFNTVFENSKNNRYIRESVLKGETVDRWSQMITVTGAQGLAVNPNGSPQGFLENIAGGFKRACPDTFSIRGLGALKISGFDGFAGVVGCGTVDSGGTKHSEAALLISIKGSADYYTVQWAERAAPSNQPIALGDEKWAARFKQLNPIKICPVVPGEPAPYPSCLDQK
jgi:hypothetical protein